MDNTLLLAGIRPLQAALAGREGGRSPAAAPVDLSATSGLPLWLDVDDEDLILAYPGEDLRARAQPAQLARRVLLDPGAASPQAIYWSFPDVALPTDEGVFREHGLRHNLLLLRSGLVGREFIKTWGHTQVCADGTLCPEAYGVLYGRALFLLQQQAEEPEQPGGRIRLADVRQVEAGPGDKIVVPASYGVTVVNPGDEPVVLSNLVSAEAWPVHLSYEQAGGAAYYVVARDDGVETVPNSRYAEPLPPVHPDRPVSAPELGVEEAPLYSAFVHQPGRFGWLVAGAPAVAGVC